jgi:hypothetical protein
MVQNRWQVVRLRSTSDQKTLVGPNRYYTYSGTSELAVAGGIIKVVLVE